MLDDSDTNFIVAAFSPTSPLGLVVWILAIAIVAAIVSSNKADCAAMNCAPPAQPRLVAHECLCVTPAQEKSR